MAEFRGFSGEFRDSLSCSVGILLVVALVIVSVSCGSLDSSQIEREKALKERVEEESKRVAEAQQESQRVHEEVVRVKQEKRNVSSTMRQFRLEISE